MAFVEDTAYILHKTKHKDSSFLVDLLTLESGRIKVLARAARQPSSKYQYLNGYFVLLKISYKDTRYKYLSFAEPLHNPPGFVGGKLACALYVNELLSYSLPFEHAYKELFNLYGSWLGDLEDCLVDCVDVKLRLFEKHMLSLLGYHYRFDKTYDNTLISKGQYYKFVPGHGFVESVYGVNRCFSGDVLLHIADNDYSDMLTRYQAKQIMRIAIQHMIGNRELKSRKLFLSAAVSKKSDN